MRPGREILPWALGGALLASVALNTHLYRTREQAPEPTLPCAGMKCNPMRFGNSPEQSKAALARLCLSEEQRNQLTGCCGKCCRELIGLGDTFQERLAELETALDERPVDEDAVNALVDEITGIWGRRLQASVHSVLKVRETLNPEQLDLLLGIEATPAETESEQNDQDQVEHH